MRRSCRAALAAGLGWRTAWKTTDAPGKTIGSFRSEGHGQDGEGMTSEMGETVVRGGRPAEVKLAGLTVNRHEVWVPVLYHGLDMPQKRGHGQVEKNFL